MTVYELVERRIRRSRRYVFLRSDFNELGSPSQVGRSLLRLCKSGRLLKIGHGVYTKARFNRISNNVMPASPGGADAVFIAVLRRLNLSYELTGMTADYMQGKTSQVPAFMEVKLKKRLYRKLIIGKLLYNLNVAHKSK